MWIILDQHVQRMESLKIFFFPFLWFVFFSSFFQTNRSVSLVIYVKNAYSRPYFHDNPCYWEFVFLEWYCRLVIFCKKNSPFSSLNNWISFRYYAKKKEDNFKSQYTSLVINDIYVCWILCKTKINLPKHSILKQSFLRIFT